MAPPKAFISYSWEARENPNHREWVYQLARRLRADGVDVLLDKWIAPPGTQLPQLMEQAIRESDFVLMVCTPVYKRKADAREGGVGYEGTIISSQFLLHERQKRNTFIPLLRRGEWPDAAPTLFLGTYYLDFSADPYDEANYEELLSTLLGQREQAPPVGKRADKTPDEASWQDISWYKAGLNATHSVGLVASAKWRATCFLVSPNLVLTPWHVVRNDADAGGLLVRFPTRGDGADPAASRNVRRLLWSGGGPELDASLLELDRGVDDSYRALPLVPEAVETLALGEDASLIGYTGGSELSLHTARLVALTPSEVHYSSPRALYSSGSPVFNRDWKVIALHHAWSSNARYLGAENGAGAGVRVDKIFDGIKVFLP